jgi:hypothetical protein
MNGKESKREERKNSDYLKIILYISFRDAGLQNTKCYDGNETKENVVSRRAAYNCVRQASRTSHNPKEKKENTREV